MNSILYIIIINALNCHVTVVYSYLRNIVSVPINQRGVLMSHK